MQIKVLSKEGSYWLSIDGQKKALINLGIHGEIVTAALEEAAQQTVAVDVAVRCQTLGCMGTGKYLLCEACANPRHAAHANR